MYHHSKSLQLRDWELRLRLVAALLYIFVKDVYSERDGGDVFKIAKK